MTCTSLCLGVMAAGLVSCATSCYGEDEARYGVGSWNENRGNHRALVKVLEKSDAVRVHIPWRRRDLDPEKKAVWVFDAATGQQINDVVRVSVTKDSGDIIFKPQTVPGTYEVYYMPYNRPDSFFTPTVYAEPKDTAESEWVKSLGVDTGKWKSLPKADVLELQARDEFNRYDPMEVPATAQETADFLAKYPNGSYLLFPEDRKYPIRMVEDLPLKWIKSGPADRFTGSAQPGDFYVFQIGVYAAREDISAVSLRFSDLKSADGKVIPSSAIRCFNLGGTDWLGRPVKKTFVVGKGLVRALWLGVDIPKDSKGVYQGTVKFSPAKGKSTDVHVKLDVNGSVLADHGDSDIWKHARLRWLDSTIGLDNGVIPPYTPLVVSGQTISCIDRDVKYGRTGMPVSIKSNNREILARPMDWVVETSDGKVSWMPGPMKTTLKSEGVVTRQYTFNGGPVSAKCWTKMEFDGSVTFRIAMTAKEAADLKDIRLEIPMKKDVAAYMMGFGREGGYRPDEYKWAWDINRCDNMVWLGDWNAGIQCKLKDTEDTWEIFNLKESGVPQSWGNDGKGGATIVTEGDEVVLRAYSGARSLKAGDELQFRFRLLITPFHPIDNEHWNRRYGNRTDGNILHIHHSEPENPYINYPFLYADKLAKLQKEANSRGQRLMIYYTVRELTDKVTEMWALRSLGNEIFSGTETVSYFEDKAVLHKSGGGYSWLQEHLVSNYVPAWQTPLANGDFDASIATTSLSRWHNYYLEGLSSLLKHGQMEGLYLDGIGYDRAIMMRVRKIMRRVLPDSFVKFHSGNNFSYLDSRVSPMNQYMEHLPFIDDLWFGEGYDYGRSPDYWFVEVSGIPFGLTGEMLHGGGNPWRGMVYGMTNRLGWSGGADPRDIWKLWDSFGIQDSKMIGYWESSCPVKTDNKDVLATAYVKKDKVLISIASWAKDKVDCKLVIDWKALGLDPSKCKLTASAIPQVQDAAEFAVSDSIPVEPGKGWMLVLESK